jgi:2-polyprenyl-3-methyl-5-hydroxy-6-metoxy-1,4-benzoquinol methylase
MQDDAARWWDERYAMGDSKGREPAAIIRDHLDLLPKEGKAFDLAMGSGRNALFLASQGLEVTGIDISKIAVERCRKEAKRLGLKLETHVADATQWDLGQERYDLILNLYFLERALAPAIIAALKPGGILVFETYTLAQLDLEGGPRTPTWLLHPSELPVMFRPLRNLYYRDAIVEEDGRAKGIASLIGQKRGARPA